jgi:hypothetical protein
VAAPEPGIVGPFAFGEPAQERGQGGAGLGPFFLKDEVVGGSIGLGVFGLASVGGPADLDRGAGRGRAGQDQEKKEQRSFFLFEH